mmetsp:Transcript_15946/g.40545  ORF Transcript_15946/g.40545 Transcript_15946/m.40545 type:complete len:262 (+) Transcript_15946:1748-2533(+)
MARNLGPVLIRDERELPRERGRGQAAGTRVWRRLPRVRPISGLVEANGAQVVALAVVVPYFVAHVAEDKPHRRSRSPWQVHHGGIPSPAALGGITECPRRQIVVRRWKLQGEWNARARGTHTRLHSASHGSDATAVARGLAHRLVRAHRDRRACGRRHRRRGCRDGAHVIRDVLRRLERNAVRRLIQGGRATRERRAPPRVRRSSIFQRVVARDGQGVSPEVAHRTLDSLRAVRHDVLTPPVILLVLTILGRSFHHDAARA